MSTPRPAESHALPAQRVIAPASEVVDEFNCIRDLLRWAQSRFEAAGLVYGHGQPDAASEAHALIAWALHLAPDALSEWLDARLTRRERAAVAALIETRCALRQPAAYLTGEAWLQGVQFRSDARALVPRSLIAEALASSLPDWLETYPRPDTEWPRSVLDLCTGGGSLAVLACLAFESARVTGADISRDALSLAADNLALHGLAGRVRLAESDLFGELHGERFDLILCNPPYVPDASMARLPAEFRNEPVIALAGGSDGMDLIRRLIQSAAAHLTPSGLLLLEIGHEADHFEAAFPSLEFAYLPVAAGERMLVLIESAALAAAGPVRRHRRS